MTLKQPLPVWTGPLAALALAGWVWVDVLRQGYVEIGPDEGMEMAKALLLAKAPGEAGRAWTDQPWLYARVLAGLWQLSGGEWLGGRLFSVGVAGAWLLALPRLMPRGAAAVHGLCGGLFLLSWPQFMPLGCSMMVEVPCVGIATLALAPLMGVRRLTPWHCAASALLAGLATSLKLVALLFFPAWLVALGLAMRSPERRISSYLGERRLWVWVAVFLVTAAVLVPWGLGGPEQGLILPHWRSEQVLWEAGGARYAFSPVCLLPAAATLGAVGAGWVLLGQAGRWREGLVPGVLLAVPLLVHLVHRPFWNFYLLHFAPGAAVLGGWGMGEALLRTWRGLRQPDSDANAGARFERLLMVAAVLLAGWFSLDLDRAWRDVIRIQGNPRVRENPLVLTLREAAARIRYCYSRNPAFPAQANCLAVPELTIMPWKRFWSGDLTEPRVREIVARELPDALILRVASELADPAWQGLIATQYTHVLTDRGLALYLRGTNGVNLPRGLGGYLRALGL